MTGPEGVTAAQRLWTASRSAERLLSGSRPVTPAERLADLAASPHAERELADVYGNGIVATLEHRIAELLGKPAALWFPTGTMAQQAILRVWTARAGSPRVAVHPLHHTQIHEDGAMTELSGLEPVILTSEPRQPTADDLRDAPGELGAAVVELPLQELGYVLPTWDELTDFAAAAGDREVALHFDGARIWESAHHYGRSPLEIAALASSVYVSMYKGVGGISGALVAADSEVIHEARLWRSRFGGNVFQQYPAIVAALDGLDRNLGRMATWHQHAATIADGLHVLPELRVTPYPPHISEFFVYSTVPADALNRAVLDHLEATGERWLHGWWTDDAGSSVSEATIRDGSLQWTSDDVARVGRAVLDNAGSTGSEPPTY